MKPLLTVVFLLFQLLTQPFVASADFTNRPNIVLIMADDLGAEALPCYGKVLCLADVLPPLASLAKIPLEHDVDGMDLSHNLLGTSGEDRKYFPMAFEGDCWFVRDYRFRLHEDGRFYHVPVESLESRYSMETLEPGSFRDARDRLRKQLDRFMAIRKVDDSYSIIPFGVVGDRFKTQQLANRSNTGTGGEEANKRTQK